MGGPLGIIISVVVMAFVLIAAKAPVSDVAQNQSSVPMGAQAQYVTGGSAEDLIPDAMKDALGPIVKPILPIPSEPENHPKDEPKPSEPPRQPEPAPFDRVVPGKTVASISSAGTSFTMGGADQRDVRITQVFIDPRNPKPGDKQTIQVHLLGDKEHMVSAVSVMVKTDAVQHPVPMELVSGSGVEGLWQGTWTVSGTMQNTYVISIRASVGSGGIGADITLK